MTDVWAATIRRNAPYHRVVDTHEIAFGGDPGDVRTLTCTACRRTSTSGLTLAEDEAADAGMERCVHCWPEATRGGRNV